MQVTPGTSLYQLISGVAANRPPSAVQQQDAAQAATRATQRPAAEPRPVVPGSEPAATSRPLPRGSLVNIVT